jgi:hypothetical protein
MQTKLKNKNVIEIMEYDCLEVYTWDEAISLSTSIGLDWRFPNIDEIKEMYSKKEELNFAK